MAYSQTQNLSILNVKTLTLGEGLKLVLAVGSLSFVVLAGQFAQSRGQELSPAATENILASATANEKVVTTQTRAHRKASALDRFAASQVRSYSELLDGLTERAEMVLATSPVTSLQQAELKASLRDLDENLMQTREAIASFEATKSTVSAKEAAFEEEDLRGSLVNLQESANAAQGQLISLDKTSDQGFKISRTGQ